MLEPREIIDFNGGTRTQSVDEILENYEIKGLTLEQLQEKLEKIIKKMKEKYRKEGKIVLRDLGSDFKFVRVVDGE